MNFKAIIFDLDGTLIDNHHHWYEANKKIFSILNIPEAITDREYTRIVNGRSMPETIQILKDRNNLPHSIEELTKIKTHYTDIIYSNLSEPMPGANDLLSKLSQLPVKMAIASGASLDRIKQIVQRFGWNEYFDELVSVDHVNQVGKPDPAVFSYAAKSLVSHPEHCVVIEDAINGVVAAKAAGMTCVLVPNKEYNDDLLLSDHVVSSLEDDHLYTILGL